MKRARTGSAGCEGGCGNAGYELHYLSLTYLGFFKETQIFIFISGLLNLLLWVKPLETFYGDRASL